MGGQPEEAKPDEADPGAEEPEANTLKDASEEAVRFMEKSDEPGHAGRGDSG